jgi:hypothetical protein
MIDKSRSKNKKGTLPPFAPVPRLRERHDGWTPERQRDFVEALADTGSVRAAAHAVNMAPEGAYQLRRHPEAQEFRKAWEAALRLGVQQLEDVAMDRARYGVEVPVYHFGAVVGTRRVYNDALLMFLLRNRAGGRFSADSWQNADAATAAKLKRLREQWRKEWEEEKEKNATPPGEIRASIERKVAQMRARILARESEEQRCESPKTRALRAALQESIDEDVRLYRQGVLPAPDEDAEWEELDSPVAAVDAAPPETPEPPHDAETAPPEPESAPPEPPARAPGPAIRLPFDDYRTPWPPR